MAHDVAWAWRTMLVSPSRTTHPNSSWLAGSTTSTAPGRSALMPGRPQQLAARGQLSGQTSRGSSETAARTSASELRAMASTSAISCRARGGSDSPRR